MGRRDELEEPRINNQVSRKTANTLGGKWSENRGHRGDAKNWDNHRHGWDPYFDRSFDKGNRSHGGALIGSSDHRGMGPKGYKRPDSSIHEDVCETLFASRDVDASDIEVTVKQGCVYLNGTVKDRQMKRMAEIEIENISGVFDVQNLLSVGREKS